jgi:hypothetical protein
MLCILVVSILAPLIASAPSVSAQVQYVTATPGYLNLAMTATVTVTAPAAGTYTVVVQRPDSTTVQLSYSFTAAGQTQSAILGNATVGFKSLINKVGTYNIFLEQGNQVLSSTSVYATNQLNVFIDMVNGGVCNYIAGATRGTKMFPRFYATYTSNGAPVLNTKGAYVTFTLPDGSKVNASYHKPTTEAPVSTGFFIGKFQPNWNYSTVGPWSPTAVISDGKGNFVNYQYIGPAFVLTPAQLATNIQLLDSTGTQVVGGLSNGETVTVKATITYPTNAEAVPGFVAPLDSASRGGVVNALVGWGFYNTTSKAFGGGNKSGGLLAQVPLTYMANGTWTGKFTASSLPALQPGTAYQVIVMSNDKANPPNTGFAVASMAPAAGTTSSVSQSTTATGPAASVGGLTLSLALLTAIGTLIVGLVVGIIVRPRH